MTIRSRRALEKLIVVGLILLLPCEIRAQETSNLFFIAESNPFYKATERDSIRFNLEETSEAKLVLTGCIRLYQLFISSQDMPACNFIPSCSQFGLQAIQKYGTFRGLLMASDRIQRCHPLALIGEYYHQDRQTGKALDPVEDYTMPEETK